MSEASIARGRLRAVADILQDSLLSIGAATALVSIGLVVLSAPAGAQGIEEIVVTALRRETDLQDTPISITAFTAEDMFDRSFTNTRDIAEATPNMLFTTGGAASGGSAALAYIRGIGQNDWLVTVDPGVGIYIDGVYMGRLQGGIMDLVDLESVEVLRGPQGTLFGRNTVGGAILLNSAKPHDKFSGLGRVSVGNYDRVDVVGSVNMPLSDNLFAKVSGSSRERNGYLRRVLAGDKINDEDRQSFRGQVLWEPQENLEVVLTGDYTRTRQKGMGYSLAKYSCDPLPFCSVEGGAAEIYNRVVAIPNGDPPYDARWEVPEDTLITYGTNRARDEGDIWGVSGTITWTVSDNLTVQSISSYRDADTDFQGDAESSPVPLSESDDPTVIGEQTLSDQFSQELQLQGLAFDGRLNWIMGGFYFTENADDFQPVRVAVGLFEALEAAPLFSVPPPGFPFLPCPPVGPYPCFGGAGNPLNAFLDINQDTYRTGDNESIAGFVQGTFNVTEQLGLTAGVRYSHEEKDFHYERFLFTNPQLNIDAQAHDEWNSWTPRFGIDYKITEDVLAYFSASKGFKSGGFNGRPVSATSVASYDPEELWSYEWGIKSTWFDQRLRFNANGYYYDYTDIQLTSAQSDPATGALEVVVENAGDAEILGFEIEAVAVPIEQFQIDGGVGYLDFEYTKLLPPCMGALPGTSCTNVEESDTLPRAPEWTINVGGQYTMPLAAWGEVTGRVDWRHVTKHYHDPLNSEFIAEPGYDLVNARIIFVPGDGNWDIAVWGTNLTDEIVRINGFDVDAFASNAVMQGPPRMWGATLSYHW
jgi:iron complex outermembrane receptor protein